MARLTSSSRSFCRATAPPTCAPLEADYARLGVPELVFISLRTSEIRRLRRTSSGSFDETVFTSGPVAFDSLDGLTLQAEWILNEPRPDEFDTLSALLAAG